MTMGPLGWTLLLYCFGISISFSRASTCSHAQCDYDNVTGKADCTSLNLDCIPVNYPDAVIMDLSHNYIAELAADDFKGTFLKLAELYLDYNNISDVTSLLGSNTMGSLRQLSVRHNSISDLPSDCHLNSLKDLAVDHNLITQLSQIPRCASLQRFTADANLINYTNLRVLESFCGLVSLRHNRLEKVHLRLRSLPHFFLIRPCKGRKLILDHNDIRFIRIVRNEYAFDLISLSYNRLKDWDVDFFPIELNLASNGLQHWNTFRYHQDRNELKRLDVSRNSFGSMILPLRAEGIEFLNANNNLLANLSSTTLSGFVNLTELHVANNRLLFISPTALRSLSKLQSLYLDDNALTSLFGGVFIYQSALIELSITNNLLTKLHPSYFMGLVSLKNLYLAGNQLTSLNSQMFKMMPQIVTINLSHNELQNVDFQDCVSNLDQLQNLSLAHNLIYDTVTFLGHCDKLGTLDLSFNLIQVVPEESLSGRNEILDELELEGNPLQCDCRLTGLRDWLINNHPYVKTRCEGPTGHHGSVITDLDTLDFSCELPKAMTDKKDLSAVVGQTATLTCTATGVPAPQITWLSPNDTEISHEWQGRFATLQERILHITPVEKHDQGIFTCLAVNVLGEMDKAVVHVTVTDPSLSLATAIVLTMFVTVAITFAFVAVVAFLRRSHTKREAVSNTPPLQSANRKVGFRKGCTVDSDEVDVTQDEEYEIPNDMHDQRNRYMISHGAVELRQLSAQTYEVRQLSAQTYEEPNVNNMEEGDGDTVYENNMVERDCDEVYEAVSAPR